MRCVATVAFVALLASPSFCTDLVITKAKHTDAMSMMGKEQPAKDTTEVSWIAKDRMRIEEGDRVTIVRGDEKKMYILDVKAKTASTIDLPFDLKKYVPAEQAPMIEGFMAQVKAAVTPTTETKKIKDWNVTKYAMTMTLPMGGGFTEDIWATKDVQVDRAAFAELSGSMMSTAMGGGAMAAEFKKIDGVPVLIERTQTMMGQSVKSREEVTSIESKDPPAGAYEVPKDYTAKPFDPMSENPMGGPRARGGKQGGPPPAPPTEKPKDHPLALKPND